jgi:anti-sigma factor RsiW
LDAGQTSEVERHVQTCPACAELEFQYSQLRSRLRADAPYYSATEELRARIEHVLERKAAARNRWHAPWGWIGSAAAVGFAAALLLLFALKPDILSRDKAAQDLIAQEVVSSHVRSLMAAHLIDMRSSDQQHREALVCRQA